MKNNDDCFKNILNKYLIQLNCSAKELADASHVSTSIISRYRSGEKSPKDGSKQISNIMNGILKLAKLKRINDINEDTLKEDFNQYLNSDIDYEIFKNNLNLLFDTLNINASVLSKYLGYDPSYLSKIRNGVRRPTYLSDFIDAISKYILTKYNDNESKKTLKKLLGIKDINETAIKRWLLSSSSIKENDIKIKHFLTELDKFDLNDYIKVIHFDELKVPTTPINLPKSKFYYGLEEMKTGELDFLKSVVLDKNSKNVFMYSNMPMEDMTNDLDFSKKWMLGIAMM